MRKNTRKLKIFAVILSLLLFVGMMPITASAEEVIITNDENGVPDTVLYKALLSNLDINGDGTIQKSEAEELQYFCYQGNEETGKISSLQGLNLFQNIKIVDVQNNNLQSLYGIEGLNLSTIFASHNNLIDISSITNMKETLITLVVRYNNLSQLPNMTEFHKLQYNGNSLAGYTTDLSYNKLTYNELYYKLPEQIVNYESSEYDFRLIDVWAKKQSPDPVPDPVFTNIVNNTTGISIEGIVIPDATLEINQAELDIENSVVSYDINLIRDYEKIQPSGEITISIPCEYSDCDVFWVKDDRTKVDMNAEYVDGKYVFKTDHLSVYSLVRDSKPTDPIPGITEFTDSATGISVSGCINADLMKVEKVYNVAIDGCKQAYEISFEGLKGDILGELEFKFPVVDESLSICHISPDEKITEIISTYQNGNLTFKFDAIGTFVLYEKDSNIMGDVNLDGKTDIKDVTLIQKWIVEIVKFNEVQKKNADFNSDGIINIKDATAIQKKDCFIT